LQVTGPLVQLGLQQLQLGGVATGRTGYPRGGSYPVATIVAVLGEAQEALKGTDTEAIRAAMEKLASAYKPEQLAGKAYSLYEKFRPEIPEGQKGWGAAGELDLDYIRSLAK